MTSEMVREILVKNGVEKAWEISSGPGQSWAASKIREMVGKLLQYGSLSVKQYAFMASLITQVEAPIVPVPVGRVRIEGKVVKAEMRETAFGYTPKMLVKSPAGWGVWVSVPSKWSMGEIRGKVVKFVATVAASKSDVTFGFGSRPTPVEVLA